MKLRIQEKNITLRLQPQEVLSLAEHKKLTQLTKFPKSQLNVKIEVCDTDHIDLIHINNVITFLFPKNLLDEWVNSNKVGYSYAYDDMVLIIEKDMPRKRKSP